jgi:hypothetical protein
MLSIGSDSSFVTLMLRLSPVLSPHPAWLAELRETSRRRSPFGHPRHAQSGTAPFVLRQWSGVPLVHRGVGPERLSQCVLRNSLRRIRCVN